MLLRDVFFFGVSIKEYTLLAPLCAVDLNFRSADLRLRDCELCRLLRIEFFRLLVDCDILFLFDTDDLPLLVDLYLLLERLFDPDLFRADDLPLLVDLHLLLERLFDIGLFRADDLDALLVLDRCCRLTDFDLERDLPFLGLVFFITSFSINLSEDEAFCDCLHGDGDLGILFSQFRIDCSLVDDKELATTADMSAALYILGGLAKVEAPSSLTLWTIGVEVCLNLGVIW